MHINGIWKDGADDPVCRAAVMADLEGFPGGSDSKDLTSVLGLFPGLAGSLGEGKGYPLQCSCLENPMDRGAWQASPWSRKESDTT